MKQVGLAVKQAGVVVVIAFFISSCTFSPKVSEYQEYATFCDMTTRKLELRKEKYSGKFKEKKGPVVSQTTEKRIIDQLVFEGVVSAASFVVAGSIVITGNAIHWMEYQTRC